MKIKTSETTSLQLDWLVGQLEKKDIQRIGWWLYIELPHDERDFELGDVVTHEEWSPTTKWEQGGPIIEREGISVIPFDERWEARCECTPSRSPARFIERRGPTPLIAAMRCYVASKLGNEVDIPKELE